jgi:hypothetical protein
MTFKSLSFVLGILYLGACGVTAPPPEGILSRSENYFRAIDEGLGVAPVGGVTLVTDAAEATALFTNEFYSALVGFLPHTPLTSPGTILYRQKRGGEAAQVRLRSVRRALILGEEMGADDLASVSRDLEHRYLLVSWIDEGVTEGIQETNFDDYGTVDNSMEVRRFTWEEVKGRAEAVVLDLLENEIIWRGVVQYKTARNYGEDGGIRMELDRTRANAAIRLAEYVAQL